MYISAQINKIPIILEVPKNQSIGLMNRIHLPWNLGMIFIDANSFWMKNTRIPLSIGFFNSNGKLLQISDMEPFSLETTKGPFETKYAVETNQGWYKNIELGSDLVLLDKIKWGE